MTHKFLTANIGYAYLFQLFGFHKSLAFCFRVSLALRILAFFSLVHFFVEKWSNSAKTWENNEKSRNKGHLPERQKFQQSANWNKADEHIKNLRLKRSWNLYAKNVIRIQKIVLLSERYFYITVSLKLYKSGIFLPNSDRIVFFWFWSGYARNLSTSTLDNVTDSAIIDIHGIHKYFWLLLKKILDGRVPDYLSEKLFSLKYQSVFYSTYQ